jgi:hypothetical protein
MTAMSRTTESVIVPAIAISLAPAALLAGATLGAGAVISTLRQEYRRAKEALEAKTRAELERRLEALKLQQGQAEEIACLAAQTVVGPGPNASLMMLTHRAAVLRERMAGLAACPAELKVRYESFQDRVATSSGPVADLIEEYGRLTADIARARQETADAATDASLREDLAAMKDEIARGLPDTREWRPTREILAAKVADLERLLSTEPRAASQGIALLRRRILRKLREYARTEETDSRVAQDIRTLVADLAAKLTAVSAHPEFPDRVEQAARLLKRLGQVQAPTAEEHLAALLRLGAEVDALFHTCETDVAQREARATVGLLVQNALLSLGYRVNVVADGPGSGPTTFVAAVTPDVGVEFSVDAGGLLKTEMVSLSDSVSAAWGGVQDQVCGVVDDVHRELRKQGAKVREKYRRRLADGERLRRAVTGVPREERDSLDVVGKAGTLRRPVR